MTILLNARAWEQEGNPEISGMLNYALTGAFDGGLAADIAHAVESKNLDRRWVRASMGVMTYEHEFIVLNHALEEKRAEIAAAKEEIEAAKAAIDATKAEIDAAKADAAAAQAELAALKSDAEAAKSELATVHAIQELAKLLSAAGRIDEYVAALDDDDLMGSLLAEFGLEG